MVREKICMLTGTIRIATEATSSHDSRRAYQAVNFLYIKKTAALAAVPYRRPFT
jgi:hypothetical protein